MIENTLAIFFVGHGSHGISGVHYLVCYLQLLLYVYLMVYFNSMGVVLRGAPQTAACLLFVGPIQLKGFNILSYVVVVVVVVVVEIPSSYVSLPEGVPRFFLLKLSFQLRIKAQWKALPAILLSSRKTLHQ